MLVGDMEVPASEGQFCEVKFLILLGYSGVDECPQMIVWDKMPNSCFKNSQFENTASIGPTSITFPSFRNTTVVASSTISYRS